MVIDIANYLNSLSILCCPRAIGKKKPQIPLDESGMYLRESENLSVERQSSH